jgi:hypothetical protein
MKKSKGKYSPQHTPAEDGEVRAKKHLGQHFSPMNLLPKK